MALILEDRVAIIPSGNPNRSNRKLKSISYITVHETANFNIGANAAMHARYVANGGGANPKNPTGTSYHFVMDEDEIVRLLPLDEVGWHGGDGIGPGNYHSIAMELCVDKNSDLVRTRRRAAILIGGLMFKHSIPLSRVVQHNRWSGKNCPMLMRANNAYWNLLLSWANAEYLRLKAEAEPTPEPPPIPVPPVPPVPPETTERKFVETGYTIRGGFKALWERSANGIVDYGFPLSDEYSEVVSIDNVETNMVFQDFENVVFEWRPGIQPRISAGIRKYKYS